MDLTIRERILHTLQDIPSKGLNAVKKLIWTELNYPIANEPLPVRDWPEGTKDILEEQPTLLAKHEGEGETFDVIYIKLTEEAKGQSFPLSITAERSVINQLMLHHSFALFLFSNPEETHWHFINVKFEHAPSEETKKEQRTLKRVIRRISVGPEENLRTAAERISMLDLDTMPEDLFGVSSLDIQVEHDKAFDVQKVTEDFFRDYKNLFEDLQDELQKQTDDRQWAHDYALQFLDRTMFVYYVQRKRWLNNDPDFMESYWEAYQNTGRPQDSFVGEWLSVLYFEAFNDKFQEGRSDHTYFPDEIKTTLADAPFLNGGLFKRNELDRKHQVEINDHLFSRVFNFFNQYNFTISEGTPLDQEVAVDPEMIGKVYESLVNVSEDADQGGDAGIFYTPRVEIDLMSRLSLVDWLANQLGEEYKSLLYEVVFAYDPQEKKGADQELTEKNLWPKLDELLRSIKVVDPACGSGSFLIGILFVLDDLCRRADQHLGREETPYERKKRIIGDSLYGVDVMDWAVHVAELRLWLQLVIETDLDVAELKFRPLLPDLSFNIRPGDSLVQEVGGINLALIRKKSGIIPSHIKGRITSLIGEKRKYYNNDPERKFKTKRDLQEEELDIFKAILDHRIHKLEKRLGEIERALSSKKDLFGDTGSGQTKKDEKDFLREKEQIEAELTKIKEARRALKDVQDIPFVWDIAFVEVFEGEREGFDVVIGNPPYVRQEKIHDPKETIDEATTESKKAYKNKLRRSVYSVWPETFGYDWNTGDNSQNAIGLRSDLYLYFYFHGLSLLDQEGSFCFVTSNSWLDVDYGKTLQKFLLTRGKVKFIIDNESYRSFERADVNTVIVLFSKPRDRKVKHPASLDHKAHFVMVKVPFEQVLSPVIWEEVENLSNRKSMPEYRIFPRKQSVLLENGKNPVNGNYEGDKWGGKYLRAPDIYWTIMKKSSDKLVQLGDIADVRRGITTGANAFFYLTKEEIDKWGLENKFLKPIIKSPRECQSTIIDPRKLSYKVFLCNRARPELKNTATLEYIKWGEEQGFHKRPTTSSRKRWWDLGDRSAPQIITPASYNDLYRIFLNSPGVYVDKRLYEIRVDPKIKNKVFIGLYSSITTLFLEILSRTSLGEGLIDLTVYETELIPIIRPELFPTIKDIKKMYIDDLEKELKKKERLTYDNMIFDILDLTESERDSVYKEIIKLVNNRLQKADSV